MTKNLDVIIAFFCWLMVIFFILKGSIKDAVKDFYNQKLFYLLFARFDKNNPKIPRGWRQLRVGEKLPENKYFVLIQRELIKGRFYSLWVKEKPLPFIRLHREWKNYFKIIIKK